MLNSKPALPYRKGIRNVPDFPKTGIQLRTSPRPGGPRAVLRKYELLTPITNPVTWIGGRHWSARVHFASAAALRLKADSFPSKKGKLLTDAEQAYDLEYGTATVAIHVDALKRQPCAVNRRSFGDGRQRPLRPLL